MTQTRCLICDFVKEARSDHCDGCGRITQSREVASENAVIAPGSALRFRDQRRIYETTKPKEEPA